MNSLREYKTDLDRRLDSEDRRNELRQARRCINGPKIGNVGLRGVVHGPPVVGGRCRRCDDVKKGRASS